MIEGKGESLRHDTHDGPGGAIQVDRPSQDPWITLEIIHPKPVPKENRFYTLCGSRDPAQDRRHLEKREDLGCEYGSPETGRSSPRLYQSPDEELKSTQPLQRARALEDIQLLTSNPKGSSTDGGLDHVHPDETIAVWYRQRADGPDQEAEEDSGCRQTKGEDQGSQKRRSRGPPQPDERQAERQEETGDPP